MISSLLGAAAHQLIVAGDVRLAFRAVRNDVADAERVFGRQLHMRREARAAEADDARILHAADDLVIRDLVDVLPCAEPLGCGVEPVVFDDDTFLHRAGDRAALLHSLDLARYRADHMCRHKAVGLADALPDQHRIVLFHDRLGGLADMLRHRKDHFALCVEYVQRLLPTQLLLLLRMNAAAKRNFQLDSPLYSVPDSRPARFVRPKKAHFPYAYVYTIAENAENVNCK